jgi:hypothetical protein
MLVYDLYVPNQESLWVCWLINPAMVAARNSGIDSYEQSLARLKQRIQEIKGTSFLTRLEEKAGTEGLDLNDIVTLYQGIGLVPIEETQTEQLFSLTSDYNFANFFIGWLERFGPLVYVRKAYGAEAIHASCILGIKGHEIVIGDKMNGKKDYYHISDLYDNYRYYRAPMDIPTFWYYNKNHNDTITIPKIAPIEAAGGGENQKNCCWCC